MENRELDKWLATNVMRWYLKEMVGVNIKPDYYWFCDGNLLVIDSDWQPTESDSDAFQVVEKMLPDYTFNLYNGHPDKAWEASFMHRVSDEEYVCGNKDLALVISLAAKKAIEGEENDG